MDLVVVVLLVVGIIRGILRGTVAQGFAFFGLVAGIVVGAWVSHAVALHWRDARPVFVFAVLRWLVSGLSGLAVTTLFGWWGESLAKVVHEGPLGWLDRSIGGVVGFAFGAAVAAVLVLLALQAPGFGFARSSAAHGRLARPLVHVAAGVTAWHGVPVPGVGWLHGQFVSAERHFPR
jgi:uncharacterized membrane protein required for colicin V production